MATTFNGKISLDVLFNEIISTGNQKTGIVASKFSFLVDLATGTADNTINCAYAKTESAIGAGVTTAYDLVGSLVSTDGSTTLNFDEVVLIAVRNRSSTAANFLKVGPAAANGFGVVGTPTAGLGFWADASDRNVIVADNAWVVMHAKVGIPAAAGTSDQLVVITDAGSASNTWDIMILGRDN